MPRATNSKPGDHEDFRKTLESLRDRLRNDLDQLTDEALQSSAADANGHHSKVPVHLADLGSESFEQELTLGVIENEQATYEEIRAALERLDAGSFGNCEACSKPISKARLEAIPYTRYCIDCARDLESSRGAGAP